MNQIQRYIPHNHKLYYLRMNLSLNRPQLLHGISCVKLDLSDYAISSIRTIQGYKFKNHLRFTHDSIDESITIRYKDVELTDFDIEIVYTSKIKDDFIKKYGDNFKDAIYI